MIPKQTKKEKIEKIKELVEKVQKLTGKKLVFEESKILTESFKTWLKEANVFSDIPKQFRQAIRYGMGGENSEVQNLPFSINNPKKVKPIMDAVDTVAVIGRDQKGALAFIVLKTFTEDKFQLYIGEDYRQKYKPVNRYDRKSGTEGVDDNGQFVAKDYENRYKEREMGRYFKPIYELRVSNIASAVNRIVQDESIQLTVFKTDKNRLAIAKERDAAKAANRKAEYKGGISAETIKKFLIKKSGEELASQMDQFKATLQNATKDLTPETLKSTIDKLTNLYKEISPKLSKLASIERYSKDYAGTRIFNIIKSSWEYDKKRLRNLLQKGDEYPD